MLKHKHSNSLLEANMNTFSVLFIIPIGGGSILLFCLTVLPIFSSTSYAAICTSPEPEILHDPVYGQHGFLQLKEVRLHVVENGDKRKPLMLFLHGFPDFWFSWRHQIVHFAKTHWVVAIDMRGYGKSNKPLGIEPYGITHLRNDVVEVISALGRQNCTLVGHDFGAGIAWTVAAYHPKIIQKLIIIDGPHPNEFVDLVFTSPTQFMKSQYVFFFQLRYVPETFFFRNKSFQFNLRYGNFSTPEEINAYEYTFRTLDSWTPPLNYYRNIFKPSFSSVLPKIQVLTLIIWGENDIYLNVPTPAQLEPYVKDFRIRVIPDAGHFVHAEKPLQVNRFIDSFVAGYN